MYYKTTINSKSCFTTKILYFYIYFFRFYIIELKSQKLNFYLTALIQKRILDNH
jgi:hypothetical protein